MPNVTVRPPSSISVRVGNQNISSVQSVNSSARTLKSASDLNISGGQTGDVIIYDANTHIFSVTNITNSIGDIDGGIF